MPLIVTYVILPLVLLLVGGLGGWKITESYSEAKFEKYKAEVEKVGYKQQADNWKEKLSRDAITQELERNNAATKIDLDNQYAAARKRLLNTKPGSGSMSTLPDPSECGKDRQDNAFSASAVHEFEGRILDILTQGDKAINSQIILEDWLKKQLSLSNNKAKGLLTE